MPTPLEVLRADCEQMPFWLANYQPSLVDLPTAVMAYLGSRVAFYPGSGVIDGELFETFTAAHAVHCVLHVDSSCASSLVSNIVCRQYRPYVHVAGYCPLDVQVWDAAKTKTLLGLDAEHPFDQEPALQGACWAVLEREPGLSDSHGPHRIALLHVQCEAIWLFWNLWVRVRRQSSYGILLQDHGYGGNWTTFGRGGALRELAVQSGQLPNWLLSDGNSAWPHFRRVTEAKQRREFQLPPELQMAQPGSSGGRALYANDNQSSGNGGSLEDFWPEEFCRMKTNTAMPAMCDSISQPELTGLASPYSQRRLYFAYGSNMDPIQFSQRCPGSVFVGTAVLQDHLWYITGGGVASVKPYAGRNVFGTLARLTAEDETQLDRFEGVHRGLYRREFHIVEVANGGSVKALVYMSNDDGFGTPRAGYLERVLVGASHHGLPAAAIAEITASSTPRSP